jgi:hypothetical protein
MNIKQRYELTPVGKLQEHPRNPRRGNIGAIAESIDEVGWYGACVVQESTGFILAGNHRYRTAVSKGADVVPTIWLDVDDESALKILLGDNKIADLGTYDEEVLEELLGSLETLDGTGFGLQHVEQIEEGTDEDDGPPGPDEIEEDRYTPQYGIILVVGDEDAQRKVYEHLTEFNWDRITAVDPSIRLVAV